MKYTDNFIVLHTHKYQCRHHYIIHKYINKNADIMQVQCRNHSCTGNIYNKIPQKTWVKHCVKCTKRITYNKDIVTATPGTISFVSAVTALYYQPPTLY